MKKVYLLYFQTGAMHRTFGCVSSEEAAKKWEQLKSNKINERSYNGFREFTLDDPELLNRIAKESEEKK